MPTGFMNSLPSRSGSGKTNSGMLGKPSAPSSGGPSSRTGNAGSTAMKACQAATGRPSSSIKSGQLSTPTAGSGTALPPGGHPRDVNAAMGKETDARKAILNAVKKAGPSTSRRGTGKHPAQVHSLVDKLLAAEAETMGLEKKERGGRPTTAAQGGQRQAPPQRGQRTTSPQPGASRSSQPGKSLR